MCRAFTRIAPTHVVSYERKIFTHYPQMSMAEQIHNFLIDLCEGINNLQYSNILEHS